MHSGSPKRKMSTTQNCSGWRFTPGKAYSSRKETIALVKRLSSAVCPLSLVKNNGWLAGLYTPLACCTLFFMARNLFCSECISHLGSIVAYKFTESLRYVTYKAA